MEYVLVMISLLLAGILSVHGAVTLIERAAPRLAAWIASLELGVWE